MSPVKKTSSQKWLSILVALVLFGIFLYLNQNDVIVVTTPQPIGITHVVITSVPVTETAIVVAPDVEIPSEIAVYFTDPVIPHDGVTTGGIEDNLIALINDATISIDAAMYEFDLENVAQALIAAHQRGVKVRIV